LKIFHFSQKCWGKYVAMATMICVKHFMNIVDIFINSCLKNNLRKKKGKNMLPWQPRINVSPKSEKYFFVWFKNPRCPPA
jgi:hypothetical protein